MLRPHCSFSIMPWHQRIFLFHAKRIPKRRPGDLIGGKTNGVVARSCSIHPKLLQSANSFSSRPSNRDNDIIKKSAAANKPAAISEAQRRSAQLELDQMTQSTTRLLAITDASSISDAIVNEARVALQYWSRRWYMHFHPGFGRAARGSALSLDALRNTTFGQQLQDTPTTTPVANKDGTPTTADASLSTTQQKSGDYGARQAELILDWVLSHNLVTRDIFNMERICSAAEYLCDSDQDYGVSLNTAFAQIMDTYLLPCAYNGVGAFGNYSNEDQINLLAEEDNQRHYATLSKHYTKSASYVKAVVDATRVMKKMREVHAQFPNHVAPDTLSVKAELNLWSKRTMALGAAHVGVQRGGIQAGNIVLGHIQHTDQGDMLRSFEENEGLGEDFYTSQGCLREMETILVKAEEQYATTRDDVIKPLADWYNHLLSAWARSDLKEAPEKSKQMLRGMEAFADGHKGNESDDVRVCWAAPDIISYNIVLFCLSRDATRKRAKEALNLFERLKDRYEQTNDENIRPDEVTYGSVLHALAQVGMAHEAEQILDAVEDKYGVSDGFVPNVTIYNTVLNAWANSSERNAPRRAESILERMRSLSSRGKNTHAEPDIVSISTVMSCHARSGRRDGAERAEELLDQAIQAYSTGANTKTKPDSIMFNCAILAWAHCSNPKHATRDKSGSKDIPAERAERLLRKLQTLRESNVLEIAPVAQTYNIVLDCWAKSSRKDAADRAHSLLREMSSSGVTPDECSYNSVLNAYAKQPDMSSVQKAEDLFAELITLSQTTKLVITERTYNVMINVHSKSWDDDGARKAEELLRTMEKNGIPPHIFSYNSCIDAFARRGDTKKAESLIDEMIELAEQGRDEVRPTIHSFASLVNAIANSNAPNAIDHAEDVVRRVEELDYVKPNSVLYNSLILTIMKSKGKDNMARADCILKRMEQVRQSGNSDVELNSYAYGMVLTLCARSNEPDAAVRASNILNTMEDMHSQGHTDVIANSQCYSAVITAWARSNSPDAIKHAFDLIDRMEQNRRNGSPHGTPNAHCYNSCIHAIAKSNPDVNKAKYCLDILQRMNNAKDAGDFDSAPTSLTFQTILNACAYSRVDKEEDRKSTFDLARQCFQTLLESKEVNPECGIFANFLLVISRHLGKGEARDHFAEAVFREACRQGIVEKKVLFHFRNASPSAAERLLPSGSDAIPDEWAINVQPRNAHRPQYSRTRKNHQGHRKRGHIT